MRGSALTQANLRCCLNCRCKLNPRSKHGTLERDILKNDASKCVHDNSSQHLIFTASWRRHRVALQVGAHRWVVGAGWAVTGRVGGPSCSSPSSPDIFPRRHITPTHAHTTKQRAGLPSLSPSQISTPSNGSGNFAAPLPNQGAPRTPPDSTVTVAYDGEDGTPPRLSCYV